MSEKDELDKTIEELEAEILAELDEANGQDAPMKRAAAPAEKSGKVKGSTPGGEVVDTGKPVVDPEQKDTPAKKSAAKAKEISGDAQQKGEGKPEKPEKLAAGDELEHDGEELDEDTLRSKAAHVDYFSNLSFNEMKGLIKSHQSSLAEQEDEDEDEDDEDVKRKKDEIEEKIKSINVKEDVAALIHRIDSKGLDVQLVNINPGQPRNVIIQGL